MSTRKAETRVRLLEAARKLLLSRGFHGVGLEEIAAEAGVSRQAVYKSHFASKAELLLALVRYLHVADDLDALIEPVYAAPSGPAMLEAAIRAIVTIEGRLHDVALVLSAAASSDEGAAAAWHDRTEAKRGGLRDALQRVAAERRLRTSWTVDQAVDVVAVLVSVEAYEQLVVERGWSAESMIARVYELCEQTLLVESPGVAAKRLRRTPAPNR